MDLSRKTALLVIDMQQESLDEGFYPVWNMRELVEKVEQVIGACRAHGLPVVYTQHTYRADGIDCALCEPRDDQGRPMAYVKGTPGWEIPPALQPQEGDIVIEKARWSAFYGTSLDLFLRGMGVEQVIVAGVVTDGCVQTSVYDAFFNDYHVLLVKDGCGAYNQGCHEAAVLNMVNWVYGLTVIETAELQRALQGELYRAWTYAEPNTVPFSTENMHALYKNL